MLSLFPVDDFTVTEVPLEESIARIWTGKRKGQQAFIPHPVVDIRKRAVVDQRAAVNNDCPAAKCLSGYRVPAENP